MWSGGQSCDRQKGVENAREVCGSQKQDQVEFEGQEFVVPTSWECLGRGSQENVIVDLPYVEEYVEII